MKKTITFFSTRAAMMLLTTLLLTLTAQTAWADDPLQLPAADGDGNVTITSNGLYDAQGIIEGSLIIDTDGDVILNVFELTVHGDIILSSGTLMLSVSDEKRIEAQSIDATHLYMDGGTITCSGDITFESGEISNGRIDAHTINATNLTMTGGSITCSDAITFESGEISNGRIDAHTINATNLLTMTGGRIDAHTINATNLTMTGGSITCSDAITFESGEISDGRIDAHTINATTLTMTGGIIGPETTINASTLYMSDGIVNAGEINARGGTISGGRITATGQFVAGDTGESNLLTISDGTIISGPFRICNLKFDALTGDPSITATTYYIDGDLSITGFVTDGINVYDGNDDESVESLNEYLQVNGGTTLTKAEVYSVVFNANAEDYEGTMSEQIFMVGEKKALSECTFTREGYMFDGWAESLDGSVKYADEEEVEDLTTSGETKILYAHWTQGRIFKTGTYDVDADTDIPGTIIVVGDVTLNVSAALTFGEIRPEGEGSLTLNVSEGGSITSTYGIDADEFNMTGGTVNSFSLSADAGEISGGTLDITDVFITHDNIISGGNITVRNYLQINGDLQFKAEHANMSIYAKEYDFNIGSLTIIGSRGFSDGMTVYNPGTIANNNISSLNEKTLKPAYTVILDRQGATTGSESVTATYGADMPAITPPTMVGYDFCGYYTETDGGGIQYYDADGTSTRTWDIDATTATTLYAKWEILRFKIDGIGITYEWTSETTVKVVGYNGASTSITILPSVEHNGVSYNVTEIGEEAFKDNKSLVSIDLLPEAGHITVIGARAFKGCTNLSDNDNRCLPASLTTIEEEAFSGCNLTKITIPETVTSIGQRAFADCPSLTSVTLPETETIWGENPFEGCSENLIIYVPEHLVDTYRSLWPDANILAVGTIPYIAADGTKAICTEGTYTVLTGDETSLGTDGTKTWYVVNSISDIDYDHPITLNGDVNLILADGKTMNIGSSEAKISGYGLRGNANATLTVYGQSEGTGNLNIYATYTPDGNLKHEGHGIYLNNTYTQYGGEVTIDGTSNDDNPGAVGIYASNIAISGGVLTINSSKQSDCIHATGTFTISGGTVNTTKNNGISINIQVIGDMTVSGGTLYATSNGGTVICGNSNIYLNGGTVTANNSGAAGYGIRGNVTLGGGTLTTSSFDTWNNASSVTIASGFAYTNGEIVYNSATPSATLAALTDVTLTPKKDFRLCTATVPDQTKNAMSTTTYGYREYDYIYIKFEDANNPEYGVSIGETVKNGETTLTLGTDYEFGDVYYSDMTGMNEPENVNDKCLVEIKGIGEYAGTIYAPFTIVGGSGSGTWGDNNELTWSLTDGALSISLTNSENGNKAMKAAAKYDGYPWYTYSSIITTVNIGEGVTSVADHAFGAAQNNNIYTYNNVAKVTIPTSVTSIGADAFKGCISTTDVYCYANPSKLSWGDTGDDFILDNTNPKQTKCHVADATAWGGFSNVNVNFVDDLADVSIPYIDADGNTAYCTNFTVLDNTKTGLDAGWYVVNGTVDYTGQITLNGDVNLILADGCTMNINHGGSTCIDDEYWGGYYSLTIYGQTGQTGTLSAYSSGYDNPTVKLKNYIQHGGKVTINSGGIALCLINGDFTLTHGTLNVTGSSYHKAIELDNGHAVTVSGGTLNATGGYAINGNLNMTGGTVNANGSSDGIITGTVTIAEQMIDCTSGTKRAITESIDGNMATALQTLFGNNASVNASFSRTFTSGVASTLCLPFDHTPASTVGTFYDFTSVDEDWTTVTMTEASKPLKANTPYLFKSAATGEQTFSGTATSGETTAGTKTVAPWTFTGTYEVKRWDVNTNNTERRIFGFATGQGYEGTAASTAAGEFIRLNSGGIKPFRAYLEYTGSLQARTRGEGGLPETMTVRLVNANGEIQGIGEIRLDTGEVTFDSNAWFDLNGRRLEGKPSEKGIYINGGRKVVIK